MRLLDALSSPAVWISATVISIGLLVGSVAGAGWAVKRLPEDFLVAQSQAPSRRGITPVRVLRNVLGAVLLLLGILMLALPGQGVLTVIAALSILDFPGKRRLMARLLRVPSVFRAVNRLRERSGKPPLRSE
jgi:hypothetical protein